MKFKNFLITAAACAMSLFSFEASAQPYYTNSTPANGAYQYNGTFPTPLQPSKTLAAQYAAGEVGGVIPATQNAFYTVTNNFGTNIYTVPPSVIANAGTNGVATNATVAIAWVTTTNCAFMSVPTNVPINWQAFGH